MVIEIYALLHRIRAAHQYKMYPFKIRTIFVTHYNQLEWNSNIHNSL